jgi:DNA-binding NtrC family response regulator
MGAFQILVVSSDDARARPLVDLLRAGGHQVVVEPNPASAATSVSRDSCDLLVLDLREPGIDPAGLAAALTPPGIAHAPVPLEAIERAHILLALRYTRGNKRRAAQLLGIARSTLIQKVRRYGIQPADLVADDGAGD